MSLTRVSCLAVLLVAVSARLEAQAKRRCADIPIDSTNPSAPVYRECHVDRKAKSRGTPPRSTFTPPPSGPSCYRATFEFVVDTTGHPEMGTVRRVSASDDSFGSATEATIAGLLYEPAQLGGAPVRQVVKYELTAAISRVVVSSPSGIPGSASRPPRRPMC